MKFRGVMTAIVTPMQEGNVDAGGLRLLVRKQIEGGIHGIVACGSTGEGATLTDDECAYVVEQVVDEVLGRVPVIAGVGARSTHGAVAQAQAAEKAGADALLVVTPAYNKPTQAGLISHFLTVAENTRLPICLYNVPGRTAVDMLPATVAELAKHERIVAIKEATGSLERAAAIRALVGPEFAMMSGDDFTVMPFLAAGGDGVISVISNILPAAMVEMFDATEWKKLDRSVELHLRLQPVMHAMFVESNPIPVKTAAAWLAIIPSAELRLPLSPLTEGAAEVVERALVDAGLRPNREAGPRSSLGPSDLPDRDVTEARTVEMSSNAKLEG
ncbi:MAG: 4-hydroxy-tetrahydrodipicolinate synthase [Proteobacteria bacterium]|nr:4-hydroxy-tetrahydrodipicolinate synthase [Pseudomonadota bacterium]